MTQNTVMKKTPSKHKTVQPKNGASRPGSGQSTKNDKPIRQPRQVQDSNDEHIDQDFPGYPGPPSRERTIHNGSAGAFDATEHSHDDDDDGPDPDR